MRMISSSKLSSCVYFHLFIEFMRQPHHTFRWRCWVSTTLPAGTCYALQGRGGCDFQDGLSLRSGCRNFRICVFFLLKNLRRPQAESLTNSEAFRILSRLDWGSYSSLQDGLNQALHNHMSFATVKAILFATKAMPLSCSPEKNLERETCRTWHFFFQFWSNWRQMHFHHVSVFSWSFLLRWACHRGAWEILERRPPEWMDFHQSLTTSCLLDPSTKTANVK